MEDAGRLDAEADGPGAGAARGGQDVPQNVWTWEHGVQPSARAYDAIRKLTKGKVPADSFGAASGAA